MRPRPSSCLNWRRPESDHRPSVYAISTWDDTTDPVSTIASLLPQRGRIIVSDDLWALHVLGLTRQNPGLDLIPTSEAVGGLRSIKSPDERDALAAAGALADKVAAQIQHGEIPLVGRTEAEIAAEITDRLLTVGHETVEFVIVASGPNSASPHHHPGSRTIRRGEMVLFDFGGRHGGFCSDTTRCVYTGPVPQEVRGRLHRALRGPGSGGAGREARPPPRGGGPRGAARDQRRRIRP